MTDLTPETQKALAALPPEKRARVEERLAELRDERLIQDAFVAELTPRRSLRQRWRDSEVYEGLTICAFIVLIFVGGAAVCGASLGVFVGLVRAGWRAGAPWL